MRIFYYLFSPPNHQGSTQALTYELRRGVMEAARAHGASLTVAEPGLDLATWVAAGSWKSYDGALGTVPARAEALMRAWDGLQDLLPCVNLMGTSTRAVSHYVRCNEAAGIRALVAHLASVGHRRLGYLGSESGLHAELRFQAFVSEVRNAGLSAHPNWVASACQAAQGRYGHPPRLSPLGLTQATPNWAERSQAALAWWLGRRGPGRPTALVCEHDRLAWMVYEAARDLGWHLPADLALTGFDDQAVAFEPYGYNILTTIRQDFALLGQRAVELLIDILERAPRKVKTVQVPGELVVRLSTSPGQAARPTVGSDAYFRRMAREVLNTAPTAAAAASRLAATLDLTPAYVRTRFRKLFACPLAEQLARERIAQAAFLLSHTKRPIQEIYTSLGFHHHQTFVKFFKRFQGTTPRAWRTSAPGG
ncbi:MAG: substrate-binding domain-containing protein [Spirochaetes bacterium]|nr:substrate-binding domain-containing protein [Spirochaetota bacterium]